MDSKLINRQQLPASRWQQDDTPCFVPFPNQSLKYWITTLLVAMMSIVGAWAEDVTITDPYDGYFYINSQGAGTIKSSIDKNTFNFFGYVDRSGTRITGELNQDDITALAGLTYPSGYPTFLDMKAVTFVENVNITLNSIFKGLRLPYGTDFSVVPASIDYAFYSNYTKVNYNDGNNENVPIYLYLNSGGVNSAIEKLGDYLQYRTIYIKGTYTDADINTLTTAKNGVIVKTTEESGGGEGGDDPVDPTSLDYKIANRLQLTNAPTIYIDLPEIGSQTLDNYLYKNRNTGEAPYRPATIKVVATEDTTSPHYLESFEETNPQDLEIKVRGNSTANPSNGKKAYRLKFAKKGNSSDGKAHKHDLLNRGYTKRNWVLLANNFDHSMIRNALTYHLSELAGGMDFMPGYKFVDLVINNEYRGTYQVSDHCEADKDRINVNEDTGWYVEFQGRGDMLDKPMCYSQDGLQMNINNPEPAYTGTESTRADSTLVETPLINTVKDWFLNTWIQGFRSADCNSANGGWRALNDEESLLKFWLITELTGDYDGLMAVKAYREENGKLFWGPVWDKDLAYGNYNIDDTKLIHNNGNASSLVSFFGTFLFNDINLVKRLRDKLQLMVDDGLKTKLNAKIDELAALVSKTQSLSSTVFPLDARKGDENVYGSADASYYSEQLKTWLSTRIDNVLQAYKNQYNALNQNQLESNVTYDPDALWTYNGFSWNGWDRSGNMNKIVNVDETNRTYKAGVWNTFCVPYDLTEAQMATIFGDSYELKVHSAMHSDGETMIFTEPDNKNIVAGYPYLLKFTGSDVVNPTFNLVQITETSNSTSGYNGHYVTYDDKHYFYGTLFTASNLNTSTDCLFANDEVLDNSILHKTSLETIAGARAFVRIPADEETIKISFTEESITPVVRTQLTNLPTIYIDTKDGAAIQPSTGDYVQAAIEVIDANNKLTPFTEIEEFLQIRGRGKAEWSVADGKKSYRLKFAKQHKYDLTGAGYTKRNWILAANAADESMIKNALTSALGQYVGMPFTPNVMFVDLVINGEYMGTYTAMDYVEADRENGVSKRVDADEKTGWLIEMMNEDGVDKTGDVYVAGTNYTTPWVVIKNPEPDYKKTDTEEVKNAAISAVTTPVQTFIDNLWDSPETYVDKTTLVNWYIASEILGGTTTLSSVYAYKDAEDTQLKFGPLWGSELAWQSSAMTDLGDDGTKLGLVVNSSEESALRNLLQSLWSESWFKNAVLAKWYQVRTDLKDKLLSDVDVAKSFISQSWAKNYAAKADDGAGWTKTNTLDNNTDAIKQYIVDRIDYLDKKFGLMTPDIEYDVTLADAMTEYSVYNGLPVNVTLKNRGTITSAYFNAITFPFSLTDTQLKDVFGDGYDLERFSHITFEGEKLIEFKFTNVSTAEAGVPYLIKPVNNVTELTFNGVVFDASEEKRVEQAEHYYCATLQPHFFEVDKTHLFISTNNQFKRLTKSGTLHGARAYFTIPEASYSKQFILGEFDDITGIENVVINTEGENNKNVYNLSGQLVGTSLKNLPKGVYVVNGKKIVR